MPKQLAVSRRFIALTMFFACLTWNFVPGPASVQSAASDQAETRQWTTTGPNDTVRILTADPRRPGTVYAVGGNGVYLTTDAGKSWPSVDFGLPARTIRSLKIHEKSGLFFALAEIDRNPQARDPYILFKSTDEGRSWKAVSDTFPHPDFLIAAEVDPFDSNVIFLGTRNRGIFKSITGGDDWSPVNNGIPEDDYGDTGDVFAVWSHPNKRNVFFASIAEDLYSHGTGGLFRTENGGETWKVLPLVSSRPLFQVSSLRISTADPNTIYGVDFLIDYTFVVKTTDGGITWNISDGNPTDNNQWITTLALVPDDPNMLFVGLTASNTTTVAVSRDGGVSWEKFGTGLHSVISPLVFDSDLNTIYAVPRSGATNTGVYSLPLTVFSMVPDSAELDLKRGQKHRLTVTINRRGGFEGNVVVTADTSTLENVLKLKADSQTVSGNTVAFDVKVKNKAVPGTYRLRISGRDDTGKLVHFRDVRLIVKE